MNKSIIFLALIISSICKQQVTAQMGFSHEIGVFTGPVAFQSDYGKRYDLTTNIGNTGFGVGIIHYLNFSYTSTCNCYNPHTTFNDHFKIRTELSYNKTRLNHIGGWVEGNPTVGKQQLKAMEGIAEVTNAGVQLEYFPLSVRAFSETIQSWAPFVAIGGMYCSYNAFASSTMGELGDSSTTFPKYLVASDSKPYGFSTESDTVWSIVSGVGTRYKISPLSDLMLEVRLQYYFSDWVDGLNPNRELYEENKANDWIVWVNFGYIYYL